MVAPAGIVRPVIELLTAVRQERAALLGLLITWVVGLYLVPWLARIGLDVNPLPTPWFLEGR